MKVRLVSIHISDHESAIDFWVNKVGFEKTTDEQMGQFRWVEVTPPRADTGVVLYKTEKPQGGFSPAVFATDDIEREYEQMKARGVKFKESPTLQPWGMKQALFLDQDGTTHVLVERD